MMAETYVADIVLLLLNCKRDERTQVYIVSVL